MGASGGTPPDDNFRGAFVSAGLAMLALYLNDLSLAVSTRVGNLLKCTFNSPSRYGSMNHIHWGVTRISALSLLLAGVLLLAAVSESHAGDTDNIGGFRMPLKPDSHLGGGTGSGGSGSGSGDQMGSQPVGVEDEPLAGRPERSFEPRVMVRVFYLWLRMRDTLR